MASEPVLTDTHTHIYYLHGTPALDEHIQRCRDNGVQRVFLPNVDEESIGKVFGTVAAYPGTCFPMLGLHPCHVSADFENELAGIRRSIDQHASDIFAIGEIGIDLYWDKSTLPYQQEAFRAQID